MFANMLRSVWTVSYTVFGMDCTEQDPVSNFRVTNDVIFVTVTGQCSGKCYKCGRRLMLLLIGALFNIVSFLFWFLRKIFCCKYFLYPRSYLISNRIDSTRDMVFLRQRQCYDHGILIPWL
jgi:hypothetical protein